MRPLSVRSDRDIALLLFGGPLDGQIRYATPAELTPELVFSWAKDGDEGTAVYYRDSQTYRYCYSREWTPRR